MKSKIDELIHSAPMSGPEPKVRRVTLKERCEFLMRENMELHKEIVELRAKLNAIRGIVGPNYTPLPRSIVVSDPDIALFGHVTKRKSKKKGGK